MISRFVIGLGFLLIAVSAMGQGIITGVIEGDRDGATVGYAFLLIEETGQSTASDDDGRYIFERVQSGEHTVVIHRVGYVQQRQTVVVKDGEQSVLNVKMEAVSDLKGVEIVGKRSGLRDSWLESIDPKFAAIYAAKKTESIQMSEVNANLATNNARQIFSSVPGLNIWESDGAGLQLGIGGRGLSPNRTSNFNTRQNGYDISADALGYPESYYTPPAEALERIQVVRGAASLQYGTQFGGMLNFVMKEGPKKPFEVVSRQTMGSWGLFNTFNSVGGTKGKLNYYGFFQFKRGDGWRPNSSFDSRTGYLALQYHFTEKFNAKLEYTHMDYNAQQAGGLTDALFEQDPRQSIRDRNWFQVHWNLLAITAQYNITPNTHLNVRAFGLLAKREALGYLGQINRTDPLAERDLISGDFKNFGTEARLLKRYSLVSHLPSTLVVGGRYYQGYSHAVQGLASAGDDANFNFNNPDDVEGSDYNFPSRNVALFAENMFMLSERLNITPGVRFEYIKTQAEGWYKNRRLHPLTHEVLFEEVVSEDKDNERKLLLMGIGVGYKLNSEVELYGNISQNYRSINFTDMQITNPNFRIDPNLHDERGYNADIGVRGSLFNLIEFDVSAFHLRYNDRIGLVQRLDSVLYNVYRLRTNVADSKTSGVESFVQFHFHELFPRDSTKFRLSAFANYAFIRSRYMGSKETAIDNKQVELTPESTLKTGLRFGYSKFDINFQYTYVSEQFTDATNATYTSNAVSGLIPAYHVMDLSASFSIDLFKIEMGCNNLTNNMYFTRRAAGYPGPGIIPSEGRSFYVAIQLKI